MLASALLAVLLALKGTRLVLGIVYNVRFQLKF